MKKLILLSAFSLLTLLAQAVTYTWNGGTGDYDDPNWSVGGGAVCCAPPSNADIVISSGEVTLNVSRSSGAIKIEGTGTLRLLLGADLLATIGIGATATNALEIDGPDASIIVEQDATLRLRNGSNSLGRGLYLHSGSSFTNRGTTDVNILDTGIAAVYIADATSTFTNNATGFFLVDKSDTYGIQSYGTFLNAGEIEINDIGSAGIELYGPGTNSGTIEVEKTGGYGFLTTDDFTNTNSGKIYIGSRNTVIGAIGGPAFTSQIGGTVVNQGLLQVDNFDDITGNGLFISITDFTNEGNINITHSSTRYGVRIVTGTINNVACANIRSNSPFFVGNTSFLINDGNIFLDTPESSVIFSTAGINGEITNTGQIEDFQGSFDLSSSFFINNGFVLAPISGMYAYGQAVPNFLQGTTSISVNPNVSINANGTPTVGTYDRVTNEFTPTSTDAICKDIFYLRLDGSDGCPVTMKIKLENPITPDAINAGEVFNIKIFLEGPLDTGTGLMEDDLRAAGLIPSTDPYLGTKTVSAATLAVTGNDAIVDWMLLEISMVADPSTIVRQIPVLLQRDGDIVNSFGISPPNIVLLQICEPYYLRLKHRNHLGVAVVFEDTF